MEEVTNSVLQELGAGRFDQMVVKPSRGASGGMLICWNSSRWVMTDQHTGRFSISVHLREVGRDWQWAVSCVYGPPDGVGREELWEELSATRARWEIPWCLLGDFNITCYSTDRNRTGPISAAMDTFSEWIDS
ncbi:hypothetical protein QJS10_CPA01g01619 [Acorus calamus]|uniref:Endonuclease/exonuclease/phosphatase domain-containing protein n=1 Tax=Acorus calamus TaxID=4465 RepID=A0AAV9FL07_ACOCL|nr:hypothetical protein QJS10_CPA01g01619 [Acorus calamus]